MVRIKVPGGCITPAQLVAVGEISRRYGRNYGELTTRQGIQLHWVRLDHLPEVLSAVQAGAHHGRRGGRHRPERHQLPRGGGRREELFDVRPVVEAVARFFYGNREYSNLPRKHKYTISACPAQCNAPEIHDVALVGVRQGRTAGVRGAGGRRPVRHAPHLPGPGRVRAGGAGGRGHRGPAGHHGRVAEQPPLPPEPGQGPDQVPGGRLRARGRAGDGGGAAGPSARGRPGPSPGPRHRPPGVHPQKQEGLVYVGMPVPMGWVRGDQLVALGELVGEFGGDVRFTRMQNLIVTGIPKER
jgi:sulfite reductase beta subunit-like hemoprotein